MKVKDEGKKALHPSKGNRILKLKRPQTARSAMYNQPTRLGSFKTLDV